MNHRISIVSSAVAGALVLSTASAVAVASYAGGHQETTAKVTARESQLAADDGHHHDHHHGGITSPDGGRGPATFDLVRTVVKRDGRNLVFVEKVDGKAGVKKPAATGEFAGSGVTSYVWPTTLNPRAVGFAKDSGILALAATSHPDFDDTPLYDENVDGAKDNDGGLWHAHWVVLVPDTTRPDGALKVRDIPAGAKPRLPRTWPGAPILLDSPDYSTDLRGDTVRIKLPLADIGGNTSFTYDGVTAALKVNADLHDPLLRVTKVYDVASGDLSLPGTVVKK